jgi:hypothetical protein
MAVKEGRRPSTDMVDRVNFAQAYQESRTVSLVTRLRGNRTRLTNVPSAAVDSPRAPSDSSPPRTVPIPLLVAVCLTMVEAAALVVEGLTLLPAMQGPRLVMAGTTAAFFLLFGVFLAYCAWQLYRLRSWARAPVVLAQLILILVGGSFWGDRTTVVAVLLIGAGAVTIAGIMSPASVGAVGRVD